MSKLSKNKKFLATTVATAAVAVALAPSASADELKFTDVGEKYTEAVNFLVGNGITNGLSDTKFGTDSNIDRVDAAVLVARALGFTKDGKYTDSGFTDVPDRAKWAVDALAEAKVISGKTETSFGAYDDLTRNETAKLVANAAKLTINNDIKETKFTDVNSTFAKYVDALVKAGITNGKTDTQFGASEAVKRGELALFLDRAKENFGFFDLTVMHTNDTHAYLDTTPFRATAIKEIREENKNNILLDAGDVFSGDLYFNAFEGAADVVMMNYLGYDAMTFGNHEFDLGSSADGHKSLAEFIKAAKFPMVSANVDFSKDALFNGLQSNTYAADAKDGQIYNGVVLDVNGEKVGVFGLTTEETPMISSTGKVEFKNYIETAKASVKAFQDQGIDKIVALSHIGLDDSLKFDNDLELAKQVEGIDIIVGGHTHSKITAPIVSKEFSAPTVIVTASEYGKLLGTLDVTFNEDGEVTVFDGEYLEMNADNFVADEAAVKLLAPFKAEVEAIKTQSTGASAVEMLDGQRAGDTDGKSSVRFNETNLGNLITDGMLAKAKTINNDTVIALQNGGGIRASIDAGDISVGEVLKVLPFANALAIMELKGSEIKTALEHSVSQAPKENGAFLHVAGMKFEYDSTKEAGKRVTKVEVKVGDTYVALEDAKNYFVATNIFTAKGGDGYGMFASAYAEGRVSEPGIMDYTTFIDHIKSLDKVEPKVEGRIVDIAAPVAK
jgi:5'-nucleotidase / UDP-sugar diphosphatase